MTNLLDTIKATKVLIGKSEMTSGNAYKVTLTHNGKRATFTFNDNFKNESDKNDFVACMVMDAQCYSCSRDYEDFCQELGYSDDSIKALKVYKACKKMDERIHRLFNQSELEELYEFASNY